MSFMIWIIEELERAEEFFYDAYLEVKDWVYPFNSLRYPLYGLYGVFLWLVEGFYEFYQWLDWAADQIDEILSWSNIRSLIRGWLDGIEAALSWFLNWTTWVGQYITDWWSGILPYILTYIDNAVEGLEDFAATWSNFWTNIFPSLVSFNWLDTWWQSRLLEIDALIGSWLASFSPFWEGWQEVRNEVVDFFADPLQWVYSRLDEFFERFW